MSSKLIKIVVIVVILVSAICGAWYKYGRQQSSDDSSVQPSSHPTYRLAIQEPRTYAVGESNDVSFQIKDKEGQVFKDIEPVHGDRVHAVLVRKDRTQFQYLSPDYDESSGTYSLRDFSMPVDGEYRLFVDFTPKNAQIGPGGLPLSVTNYVDLIAGDVSKYQEQITGVEQIKDSDNGFDINVFFAPHDPSDPGLIAKATSSFAVSVNKDNEPFRQLQLHKGTRGNIILLGPNLEFLHTHSQNEEVPDTYVLSFSLDFPTAGYYKGFLQTKTNDMINNTEYTLHINELPDANDLKSTP